MIVSILTLLIFSFVWVPLGASLIDPLVGTYCTTQYVDQGLWFMAWWILVGMGISVLVVHRYEVWVD